MFKGLEACVMNGQSDYTSSYRKNVKSMEKTEDEKFNEILKRHISGVSGEYERERIINEYLSMVVNMSVKYANRGVLSDELIQEGNLALVLAVDELGGTACEDIINHSNIRTACDTFIRNRIRQCMIDIIDGENNNINEFGAAVAKVGLVYEAAKKLAPEYGRVASISELSEYTKIPVNEIEDIIKFAGNTIETGDGKDIGKGE